MEATSGLSAVLEPSWAGHRHEAFFYSGHQEFLDGTLRFIGEALAAAEPILVVLPPEKIDRLQCQLNGESDRVLFADMTEVGSNPARIIPTWQQFLDEHSPSGSPVRGIGEPIWAGRSAAELAECQRHEALLNLAIGDRDFWLLCPYDTTTLDLSVIDEARRNHPLLREKGVTGTSATFPGTDVLAAPYEAPLPEPPRSAPTLNFQHGDLHQVRQFVGRHAADAGLRRHRASDLVTAVNEMATNSLRYGGGQGSVRAWRDGRSVLCEVRDGGRIDIPLVGRVRPAALNGGGRGFWIANQLCDLVQIRSSQDASVVRLHMAISEPA